MDLRSERGRRQALRGAGELLLAACALWLVVENAALLALWWGGMGHGLVVAATLGRAALLVISRLWMIPAAALVAPALLAALMSGSRRAPEAHTLEVHHG